jgi:hypothetical protein
MLPALDCSGSTSQRTTVSINKLKKKFSTQPARFDAGDLFISVTNTNDNGVGSLRDALASAIDGDTIQFNPSPNSIITLTGGALAITKALMIGGSTSNNLAVSGNNATFGFYAGAPASEYAPQIRSPHSSRRGSLSHRAIHWPSSHPPSAAVSQRLLNYRSVNRGKIIDRDR